MSTLGKMKNLGMHIIKRIAVEAGMEVARGYMLDRLQQVTMEMMVEAIETNKTDLWSFTEEKDKNFLNKWRGKIGKYKGDLTWINVLEWLQHDRPDLAGIIMNHKDGARWLEKTVEKAKENIFGPPVESKKISLAVAKTEGPVKDVKTEGGTQIVESKKMQKKTAESSGHGKAPRFA